MIKQLIRIIAIMVILLAHTILGFAEFQPDSPRWIWCGSNDTIGVWLDADSVYERPLRSGDTRVYIWALFYHNNPTEYLEKMQYTVDLRKRVFSVKEYVKEDLNGNIIETRTFTNMPFSGIVPGSYSETFYKVAKIYHKMHIASGQ